MNHQLALLIWTIVLANAASKGKVIPEQKPYVTKAERTVIVTLDRDRQHAVLPCEVGGNPTDYTWFKNTEKMDLSHYRFNLTDNLLTIDLLIFLDNGEYTCSACNDAGSANSTVNLEVKVEVDETILTNRTATVGSFVTFVCSLRFIDMARNPSIDYQYFKSDGDRLELKSSQNILKFENVSFSDAGWYICKAFYYEKELYIEVANRSVFLQVVNESSEVPLYAILVPVMLLILALMVGFVIYFYCQTQLKKTYYERLIKVVTVSRNAAQGSSESFQMPVVKIEKHRTVMVQNDAYDSLPDLEYEFPVDLRWELPRQRIVLGKLLGEGAFGRVVQGKASGFAEGANSIPVAVKMLRENHTDEDVKDLVCELEIMKMIGKHPNVISLVGCCSNKGPLYVIIEYATHGNLKNFLRGFRFEGSFDKLDKQAISVQRLVTFALQIATGMEYLSSIKCIHRDLAARNILVSEGYVMKIADFGLARDVQDHEYYRKMTAGKVPIRWMAPESLENFFFDSRTDVWSFGVLLWEIMTLGAQPYQNISAWEHLLQHLKEGNRLKEPTQCPWNVYSVMKECWQITPEQRPSFGGIVERLKL
ncbi:testis-specific serine/threonine-protein kinase 6 [Culex quinquefasciatus]|uniref:receptor protein-tyrosine kinase n=1 Tax=Culex quinquefasciatus TaxID=7176 RepID=B0XJJ2_CULQU|nr:testis-specific serine/threonine-protein kinase 6 [Culex quinquefasciatus]|eukprot:XP_001869814.1 testis-specific serine/threonine-protein kinase 6 [Culex quinquefasciatus]